MSICDRVTKLFSEKMHLDIPSVDADLFASGALDSLAFVELLLHLEQEFGIRVPLEELELDYFRSISRIAEFIEGHASVEALVRQAGGRNRVA